ncbi:acyl carrier protein [Streptomyces sp. NPDC059909]|uniref:acyl carrier protein n=1 Tax=Streptomyces sp. NPDC059909 TaxID=3346998 RepID=UPI00364AEFEC
MTAQAVPGDRRRLTHRRRFPDPDALRAVRFDTRVRSIEESIRRELALTLRLPSADRVATGRPLRAQGAGSIAAVRIAGLLERGLRVRISPVELLRDDSVTELAVLLAMRLEGRAEAHLTGPGGARR